VEFNPANVANKTAACERGGGFDVLEMAGKYLCADCAGHGEDEG
jgi:hypothetical protein